MIPLFLCFRSSAPYPASKSGKICTDKMIALGSDCEDAILFSPDYSNPDHTVGYSRSSVNMFVVRS
jgi:hypothetical protein